MSAEVSAEVSTEVSAEVSSLELMSFFYAKGPRFKANSIEKSVLLKIGFPPMGRNWLFHNG